MKSQRLIPVILISALITSLYVFLAQTIRISAVWLPFISWTLYSIDGANPKRLFKLIFGFTMGMMIGAVTVLLISPFSEIVGPVFALPVIVFLMVILIQSSEFIKPVNSVPAYYFAYSSYFAYYYGNFGGDSQTPLNILPVFWLLALMGFSLAVITMEIRNIYLRKKLSSG